jgi:hypothetical protein
MGIVRYELNSAEHEWAGRIAVVLQTAKIPLGVATVLSGSLAHTSLLLLSADLTA